MSSLIGKPSIQNTQSLWFELFYGADLGWYQKYPKHNRLGASKAKLIPNTKKQNTETIGQGVSKAKNEWGCLKLIVGDARGARLIPSFTLPPHPTWGISCTSYKYKSFQEEIQTKSGRRKKSGRSPKFWASLPSITLPHLKHQPHLIQWELFEKEEFFLATLVALHLTPVSK